MCAAGDIGTLIELDDAAEIEAFIRRDEGMHVYEIGDLDPFFRPRTRWFAWRTDVLEAVCLLYTGSTPPVAVAICRPAETTSMARLLEALEPQLPAQVYAHLSPGLAECFAPRWIVDSHGRHLKMQLTDADAIRGVDTDAVVAATAADNESLAAFFDESYDGHWFDARMLDTGLYRGIRHGDRWVAVAGVHVYSADYRVAALGNIATSPAQRGRGLGRKVTAAVCKALLASADLIGLNVHASNTPARKCYEALGFSDVGEYEEVALVRRR